MAMVMAHGGDGKVAFDNLPEACIANVLSFTTPQDACALSLVSSTFRSAAQSDVVWDKFLPSDYHTIIPTSSLRFPSKRDLYLHLTQKPILIDAGQKSFVLDKLYGKKCYMLSARNLFIVWGDTPRYWRWTSLPDSRFSEVAELVAVCWLEIRGRMKTCMLSPETLYGVYLVYKPSAAGTYGFEFQPVEVSIGIAGEGDTRKRNVYLDASRPEGPHYHFVPRFSRTRSHLLAGVEAQVQARPPPSAPAPPPPPPPPRIHPARVGAEYPKERGDGWWEIELGDFFNRRGDDSEVEMGVYEVNSGDWKGGIVLQGIEIRPKQNPINA